MHAHTLLLQLASVCLIGTHKQTLRSHVSASHRPSTTLFFLQQAMCLLLTDPALPCFCLQRATCLLLTDPAPPCFCLQRFLLRAHAQACSHALGRRLPLTCAHCQEARKPRRQPEDGRNSVMAAGAGAACRGRAGGGAHRVSQCAQLAECFCVCLCKCGCACVFACVLASAAMCV